MLKFAGFLGVAHFFGRLLFNGQRYPFVSEVIILSTQMF
jgi:hypothetical protein